MRAVLACAALALALAPALVPDAPRPLAAAGGAICELSPGNAVCHFECGRLDHVSIYAGMGSRVSATCGYASIACADHCEARSLLPALENADGMCTLERGNFGRCHIG